MGTAIKNPVPDRLSRHFVIFDILALWRSVYPYGNSRRQRIIECWVTYQTTTMFNGMLESLSCCTTSN